MDFDKLVVELDSFMDEVSNKTKGSHSCVDYGTSDSDFYRALGEVAYALEILPKIQLIKDIVLETVEYKRLRRSYISPMGTVLEEYIIGNDCSIIVFMNHAVNPNPFNTLLKLLIETDG
ncbi:MAG: hypothetical protein WC888_04560 [Candidatus Izemoplasmatales bacterium]|jgi:hypothetical protein